MLSQPFFSGPEVIVARPDFVEDLVEMQLEGRNFTFGNRGISCFRLDLVLVCL